MINETADTISLSTRVDIECRPASFRTVRGGSFAACICDEVAFWRSEDSQNPDSEIIGAVRPSLATTHGMLACISSPYSRSGEVYQTHLRHYGDKGDPEIIVAKGSTQQFNPTLDPKVIARAYDRDPVAAASEYGGEFRSDVDAFVSSAAVDACVMPGLYEQLPLDGVDYVCFVDPAGGSGADSFTLCIAHRGEDGEAIIDCVREVRPPFSPADVVREFAVIAEMYQCDIVIGDRYAGSWPSERFMEHHIRYEASERTKSQIYVDFLPLLNSRKVQLIDHGN